MKGKHSLILVMVAIALVAVALLSSKSRSPTPADLMGNLVLPDLPINDIEKITVSSAAGTATLNKNGDTWVSASRFNYPLDFQKVRDAIVKLSQTKIGQVIPLTDKQRREMKMLAPGSGSTNGTGTLVELFAAKDRKAATLLLGDIRQRKSKMPNNFVDNGGYPDGQYLSVDGGKTVYLVKDTFQELSPNVQEWLDAEILNINPGDVAAVTIVSRDKKEVKLNRSQDGGRLEVEGLAADEETDSEKVFSVESALSYLRFDDVASPAVTEAEAGLDSPAIYRATTAKGQIIMVRIGNSPTNSTDSYVRLDVAMKPADTNAPAGTNAVSSAANERAALEIETAALSAKLSKWTYRLGNYKVLSLTQSREQIVKKKEPPKAEPAAPAPTTGAAPVPPAPEPVIATHPTPVPEAAKPAEAESKKP